MTVYYLIIAKYVRFNVKELWWAVKRLRRKRKGSLYDIYEEV